MTMTTMMRSLQLRLSGSRLLRAFADDSGAQILEFALSLPLLMLFVVGIFDFSGALSLKQKLTAAARDSARVAAADPFSDIGTAAVPASVSDAWQAVDNFLKAENINDCGLNGATPILTAGTLSWVSTATAGCPGTGLVLTINRGCVTAANLPSVTDVVDTCVTIQYAYKWRFTSVSSVVGGGFIPPANITTTATAFNEN